VASQSDWTNLTADGYWATLYGYTRSILRGLRALWRAKESAGAEPDDNLQYLLFGDAGQFNRWRIGNSGTDVFVLEENVGSEEVPVYVTRFYLNPSTGVINITNALAMSGALTGCTGITMAGDINFAGNDILNLGTMTVGLISGVDITAHMARHLPGGADALTNNVAPPAIGAASAAGAGSAMSNSSHTHEGVHQLDVNSSGATQVKGDANLVDGAYIDITKSGQDITIAFAKPGRVAGKTSADQGTIAAEVDLTSLTALALLPATTVSTRVFEISGTLEIVTGTIAGNTTLRAYNGPLGALADGAGKKIMEHTYNNADTGVGKVISFGPMHWTPVADADLKVGLSLQSSIGNATVKGTSSRFSYVKIIEVFA
jgi:hypothetical protein